MSTTFNPAQLTDAQLQEAVQVNKDAAEKCRLAQGEINRRLQQKEEKEEENKRKEFLKSEKCKKLREKFKKASKRVEDIAKPQAITINVPITFTVKTDYYEFDVCEMDELFENSVSGKIGVTPDLNKKQRALLQAGLDQVVANACEEIYGLFPQVLKEQDSAKDDLNKVLCEAEDNDMSMAELESK